MAADRVTDAMVLAACNAYADKLGELYGEGEAVSAPMRAALTAALRAEAGAVGLEEARLIVALTSIRDSTFRTALQLRAIADRALAQARRTDRE